MLVFSPKAARAFSTISFSSEPFIASSHRVRFAAEAYIIRVAHEPKGVEEEARAMGKSVDLGGRRADEKEGGEPVARRLHARRLVRELACPSALGHCRSSHACDRV